MLRILKNTKHLQTEYLQYMQRISKSTFHAELLEFYRVCPFDSTNQGGAAIELSDLRSIPVLLGDLPRIITDCPHCCLVIPAET